MLTEYFTIRNDSAKPGAGLLHATNHYDDAQRALAHFKAKHPDQKIVAYKHQIRKKGNMGPQFVKKPLYGQQTEEMEVKKPKPENYHKTVNTNKFINAARQAMKDAAELKKRKEMKEGWNGQVGAHVMADDGEVKRRATKDDASNPKLTIHHLDEYGESTHKWDHKGQKFVPMHRKSNFTESVSFFNQGESANKKPINKGSKIKNIRTGKEGVAHSWAVHAGKPEVHMKTKSGEVYRDHPSNYHVMEEKEFIRYDHYSIDHLDPHSEGVKRIASGKLKKALWQHKDGGPWIHGYATKSALKAGKDDDGHFVKPHITEETEQLDEFFPAMIAGAAARGALGMARNFMAKRAAQSATSVIKPNPARMATSIKPNPARQGGLDKAVADYGKGRVTPTGTSMAGGYTTAAVGGASTVAGLNAVANRNNPSDTKADSSPSSSGKITVADKPFNAPQNKSYDIKQGDTLSGIAKTHGTTVDALMKANTHIKDPDKIYAGKSLSIPGVREEVELQEAVSNFHNKLKELGYKKEHSESTAGLKKSWWYHSSGEHPLPIVHLAKHLGHHISDTWRKDFGAKPTETVHPETGNRTSYHHAGMLYVSEPKKNTAGKTSRRNRDAGLDESVELDEGRMSEIHQTMQDHMDKHIKTYKRMGGAEALMGHADTAAKNIAKMHNIDYHHAKKFVSDYIEYNLHEETELDESSFSGSPLVKTGKYSWGTMKTIMHGKDFSIPLHPEHQEAIKKLNHDESTTFKDETGSTWRATRIKDTVHFNSDRHSKKTAVPYKSIVEETEQLDEISDNLVRKYYQKRSDELTVKQRNAEKDSDITKAMVDFRNSTRIASKRLDKIEKKRLADYKSQTNESFKVGDHVEWDSNVGKKSGKIIYDHGNGRYNIDTNSPYKRVKSYPSTIHQDQLRPYKKPTLGESIEISKDLMENMQKWHEGKKRQLQSALSRTQDENKKQALKDRIEYHDLMLNKYFKGSKKD